MNFFIWYCYLKICAIEWFRKLFKRCAFCGKKGSEIIYNDALREDIIVCDDCIDEQLEIMFYRYDLDRGDNYGEE